MSTQTVVDVVVSGTTATIVDKRVDGITTVAGAAPITEVTGQRPDLGVKTCLLGGEGDILSLTNDVAALRANLIVTGTTLTDEIGVLSGHLISTGNNLEFQISTLSGDLIASGNNLNALRDILSGNLIATGNTLQAQITGATGDINTVTQNLISTGNNLENQILNSGVISTDISGDLITTGSTLTSNLISTGNILNEEREILSGNLITTGQTLNNLFTGLNKDVEDNKNNLIDSGNNLEPRINANLASISTLNTVTGVLSSATGELQEYKFNKSGGTISGSILPSSSGSFNLGSPSLTFQTGFFDDLEVGSNTLFIGGVPIKSINGGINFFDATGTTTFRDVSIRNLTVTGTETIIDVEHLAVKDNIIIINSGESGAGIGVRSGGLVIDRGTLPNADFLFNENNDRFEIDFPLAVNGDLVVTQNQTGSYATVSNLIQTGTTLQSQISSNDNDITNLTTATGELKTQANTTDANLITTGQTLTSEIAIVSGIAGGSSFTELSGNLITTGQTLTSEISIVSGLIGQEGVDIDTLSGNLITTGQTLQVQVTSNDSDITTLTSNLVATGSRIDTLSGNLIVTGTTLQTQIDSNDTDISNLTSNLRATGVNLTNVIIETGFAIIDTSGNADITSGNLITTGKYLTDEIAIVSGLAGGSDITALSGNLITTGQTLTSEINVVSGLTITNTSNLISTGNNLQGQITSNDGQIAGIIGDLVTTGQTLTNSIDSVSDRLGDTGVLVDIISGNLISTGVIVDDLSGNLITTGQRLESEITNTANEANNNLTATGNYLDAEIAIVSGIAGGQDLSSLSGTVDTLSGNVITTGQYLTSEIAIVSGIAGGSDLNTLSGNLITTGQYLTDEIAIVSGLTTGSSSDPDLSGKVDTLSGNLITTGQYLTDEIAIVSGLAGGGDIDTLSGNLITTGQTLTTNINTVSSNLVATGKTLTDNVNTVSSNLISTGLVVDTISGNLITTGQTLQTQITSNDSDITSLTSNLITTGQTLTTDVNTVSGLITDNDADITALKSATGVLKTSTDNNTANLITTGSVIDDVSGNLITTGQTLQTQITSNDSDISNITSNLVTTGQTLQTQITSNDSDISTLTSNLVTTGQTLTSEIAIVSGIATGGSEQDFRELSGNLITTGQTLQTQITSNDGDITTLTSNLVTTGQTLTTNINTVSTNLVSTGKVIDDVSGNLITTGQTLQTQITSNDGDISTLTSNLVTTGQTLTTNVNTVSTNLISTGAVVDDISGNLITTGQTLQTQITSNDGDITTLTSNLVTTGQTLTTNINTVATNLGTSGQTLQTQITSNDSDISTLTSNLGTTGQTLQTQITSNDSDIASLTTNLGTTGQTLQTQITSNDSDISTLDSTTVKLTTNQSIAGNKIFTNDVTINNLTVTGTEVVVDVENLAVKDNIIEINSGESGAGISRISGGIVIDRGTAANANILYNDANDRFELNFPLAVEGQVVASASNLITTGQTLTTNINTVSTNLGTSGQTLQTQITSNDSDISTLTTNLVTTGQTLQTQITSNDSDISTLTTNLGTTGQTLQTQITSNDSDISTLTSNLVSTGSVVDDISGNLITTGQTLQTQITSNDADITTLTSNLVTTGQTLTTNINTVSTNLISTGKVVDDISGNLITTGQTLQTQITSNDTDITNLSSNLVTTGQTLTTNINTVATNLVTTGQTLTSEIATVSGLIPATVIDGGGTANKVPLWSDANTIGDSVISQSSSKIGIGVNSPGNPLQVEKSSSATSISNAQNDNALKLSNYSTAANGQFVSLGLSVAGTAGASADAVIANFYGSAGNSNLTFHTEASNTLAERMRITSAGSVGIGTNAPATTLEASGTIRSTAFLPKIQLKRTGNAVANGDIEWLGNDDSVDWSIRANYDGGGDNFNIREGTTSRLYIKSGKVGIGTNSPDGTLHVHTASAGSVTPPTAADDLVIENSAACGITIISPDANDGGLYFANPSDGEAACLRWNHNADTLILETRNAGASLVFETANTVEAMRINSSGLVGIGTNAPANTLHVQKDVDDFIVKLENDGNSTSSDGLWLDTRWNTASNTVLKVTSNSGSADFFYIKGDGKVGIGTNAPTAKLEVQGLDVRIAAASPTSDAHYLRLKHDNSEGIVDSNRGKLKLQSNDDIVYTLGNVGVGTATPNAGSWSNAVTIQGASSVGLELMKGSSLYAFMGVQGSGSSHALDIAAYQNQSIRLRVGSNAGTTAVTILNNGKVGIGTNSPANLLHVYNSSGNGEVKVERASGASILIQAQSAQGKILTTSNDSLQLGTNNTGYLTISTSGATTLIGSLTVGADDTGHDVRLYGATSGRYWEWDESMDLVRMRDNVKTVFGNGDDLQIYHDGSNSYINDAGTGRLILKTSYFEVDNAAGNQAVIEGIESGAVNLFYSGSKKFETTSTGVTVSGQIKAAGGALSAPTFGFSDEAGLGMSRPTSASLNFVTGSTERVRINSSGCVGIGTASPADTLHVYGAGTTAIFQSSSANGYISIKETSGGNHVYLGNQSGEFVIQTPGSSYSTKFQVTSAGLVGIGISPTTRLQVKDSVDNSYESGISIVRSADGATTWLNVRGGATNFNNKNNAGNAGLPYRWYQNGTERLKIESDGQATFAGAIALSTNTTPSTSGGEGFLYKHGTNGTVLSGYNASIETGSAGSRSVRLAISNTGAATFNSAFTFPTADGSAGQVLQTNGSGTVTWATVSGGGGVSGSGTDHYIPRWNGTTALQDSSVIALDSGSVGIGTATPTGRLTIKSSGNSSYALEVQSSLDADKIFGVYQDGDGDGALYLFNKDTTTTVGLSSVGNSWLTGGNFGIGTNSPSADLHIGAAFSDASSDLSSPALAIKQTGLGVEQGIYLERGGERKGYYIGMAGLDGLAFQRNLSGTKSVVMVLDRNGNVGIGTDSTAYKLEVKGSVTGDWLSRIYNTATTSNPAGLLVRIDDADSTGMILGVNNNGTYHMVVKGDGNVGIGTHAPDTKLHIEGVTKTSATIESTGNHAELIIKSENNTYSPYVVFKDAGADRYFIQANPSDSSII